MSADYGIGVRRQNLRRYESNRSDRFLKLSWISIAVLILASWYFITAVEGAGLTDLLSRENWELGRQFIARLTGAGNDQPAFLDPASWRQALGLTYQTLLMSILAIGFATIGMLLTVIPASRTAADGSLTLSYRPTAWLWFSIIRFCYILSRAIPELIWAMIIVFFFSPGILPGALALALHNFGILGKLCAEVVEDLDLRPARALRNSGASQAQILFYAILPAVLPKFLTYILYRWEVIIRTTIVVGFVSAGGLGRQFRLSMSWFHYTDVALLLLCYFVLVLAVDLFSGLLRRMAQ